MQQKKKKQCKTINFFHHQTTVGKHNFYRNGLTLRGQDIWIEVDIIYSTSLTFIDSDLAANVYNQDGKLPESDTAEDMQ